MGARDRPDPHPLGGAARGAPAGRLHPGIAVGIPCQVRSRLRLLGRRRRRRRRFGDSAAPRLPLASAPDAPVRDATAPGDAHGAPLVDRPRRQRRDDHELQRSIRGTSTGTETLLVQVGNVTTFDDTPLASDGTEYFYEVSAVAGVQEGPRSNEESATPTPDPTGEFTSLTPRACSTPAETQPSCAPPTMRSASSGTTCR